MKAKYVITGTKDKTIIRAIDKVMVDGYFKYNTSASLAIEIRMVDSKYERLDSRKMRKVLGAKPMAFDSDGSGSMVILINRDLCITPDQVIKALADGLGQVIAEQHRDRFKPNASMRELLIITRYYGIYISYSLIKAYGISDARMLMENNEFSSFLKDLLKVLSRMKMNDHNYTSAAMYLFSAFAPFDGSLSIRREHAAKDDVDAKLRGLFITQQIEMGKSLTTFFHIVSEGHTLKPYDFNALKLSIKLMDNIVSMENETAITYFNERMKKVGVI